MFFGGLGLIHIENCYLANASRGFQPGVFFARIGRFFQRIPGLFGIVSLLELEVKADQVQSDRLPGPARWGPWMLDCVGVHRHLMDSSIAEIAIFSGNYFTEDSPAASRSADVGMRGTVACGEERPAARSGFITVGPNSRFA
jgi:hypothetical protein